MRSGGIDALRKFSFNAAQPPSDTSMLLSAPLIAWGLMALTLLIARHWPSNLSNLFGSRTRFSGPPTAAAFVVIFLLSLLTLAGEELAFRAFLLPRMLAITAECAHGDLWASAAVGLVAALCHLPLFFWKVVSRSRFHFVYVACSWSPLTDLRRSRTFRCRSTGQFRGFCCITSSMSLPPCLFRP